MPDVQAGCELSRDYGVATACVKPTSIHQALDIFAGTDVLACAVIGFPHGNSTTGIKVVEAKSAAYSMRMIRDERYKFVYHPVGDLHEFMT